VADDASTYRLGDLLALARRSWVLAMARELAARGYEDYRITDAATVRALRRRPLSVGRLAEFLGVTRQAARKVARGLEERSLAVTEADPEDARKLNVVLTERGLAYAAAVTEVIALLNGALAAAVSPSALEGADRVLRAVIADPNLAAIAARIAPPQS
jgi:DNA-binding MarR family transcriptional regulator